MTRGRRILDEPKIRAFVLQEQTLVIDFVKMHQFAGTKLFGGYSGSPLYLIISALKDLSHCCPSLNSFEFKEVQMKK